MSYRDKIKCYLGYHNWHYSTWDEQSKWVELNKYHNKIQQLIKHGDFHYPMRFCNKCHKKQVRRRHDMHIFWVDTKIYTTEEIRIIQLKKILNG